MQKNYLGYNKFASAARVIVMFFSSTLTSIVHAHEGVMNSYSHTFAHWPVATLLTSAVLIAGISGFCIGIKKLSGEVQGPKQ